MRLTIDRNAWVIGVGILLCVMRVDVAAAQAGGAPALPAASPSPNVLWIIGEDLGPELGAYRALGNALATGVQTPNLDRLAEGMLFTHAFTTSPVCSPSRSALMTGMYQATIGAQHHRSHRPDDPSPHPWPLPDSVRLVTDWLRHAGYYTGNVTRFPEGVTLPNGEPLEGTGKTDWNFTYDGQPFDTDDWADLKANQPFYAQVNFPETHRGHAWDIAHTLIDAPADPDSVVFPPYYPDHEVTREDWAQYLNAVMALDLKVGLVLEGLQRDGLAENTVVVFMGDHGRAMVRGKQWPYDSGLRVPLLIRWPEAMAAPEGYAAGTHSDRLIEHIDVTATTLAFAGVPKPAAMQGRVFLGAHAEAPRRYAFGGRDRGDETVDRIRTARSKRFRYLRNDYPERPFLQENKYKEARYPVIWLMRELHAEGQLTPAQARLMAEARPEEELYDLLRDPYETVNLADSAAYQEIAGQMRSALDAWLARTGDADAAPEDPAVAAYYDRLMQEWFGEIIEERRTEWEVER